MSEESTARPLPNPLPEKATPTAKPTVTASSKSAPRKPATPRPRRPRAASKPAAAKTAEAEISAISQQPVALQVASAPHGSNEDSSTAKLPASYPYRSRMRRAEYEKAKQELQIELLKVQSWVKETGQRIVVLFEGAMPRARAAPSSASWST